MIGRAWSVKLRVPATEYTMLVDKPGCFTTVKRTEWYRSGTVYNYGLMPPRYPVPAIQGAVHLTGKGVYIADPQGYECLALWSKKYGAQTI